MNIVNMRTEDNESNYFENVSSDTVSFESKLETSLFDFEFDEFDDDLFVHVSWFELSHDKLLRSFHWNRDVQGDDDGYC